MKIKNIDAKKCMIKGVFVNHVDMGREEGLPSVYTTIKTLLSKISTKGEGGQKCPKICPHGL